jgi:Big-like domain-containing protein
MKSSHLIVIAFSLTLGSALFGCESSTETVPVDSVVVSGSASVYEGQSIQLTATAYAADGSVLEGRQFTWSSDNNSLASVSPTGLVTGHSRGVVNIRATSENVSGPLPISVLRPLAVGLSDGRARIHGSVIQESGFDPSQPLWVGWMGNEFLARLESAPEYQNLTPSASSRLIPSSQFAGWYETAAPVVGTCFTVLQFQGTTRRWANLSSWTGDAGIRTYEGRAVMKLADDGHARARLDAMLSVFHDGERKYARLSRFILPTEQLTSAWRLVGDSNDWIYGTGRPVVAESDQGITFDASGLRRFANARAVSSRGTSVWGLFGHFGDGSIDLSPAGCATTNGSGYRHPNVLVQGSSAGLWLEPAEMPRRLPYLFVDSNVGKVWWPNPNVPPNSQVIGSFGAATPWLSIVDDPRAPEPSSVEVDYLRLWAVVNGSDVPVARNEYDGSHQVGGSLASREPWFGVQTYGLQSRVTVSGGVVRLPLSTRPDSVWHVWLEDTWPNPSGPNWRHLFPAGTQWVWVEARVRIRGAAALQVGWDYNRGTTDTGCDRDNDGRATPTEDGWCEAGKSDWIFESFENNGWQVIRSKRRANESDWVIER